MTRYLLAAALVALLWLVWPFRVVEPDLYAGERVRCRQWAVSDSVSLRAVLDGVERFYHLTHECSYVSVSGVYRIWRPIGVRVVEP